MIKISVGWRNEITRQDMAEIYELTYKYQMLKQEAALGDYGVPTTLPDAAYMEFEKIKGELSQKLEDAHDRFVDVYESWIDHHQQGAEEDLSSYTYEDVVNGISYAKGYSDLLTIFSEEELQETLAEEVIKYIRWASKYGELPEDGVDYTALDPPSMTFAELTALPFTQPQPKRGDSPDFFNDLKTVLESHSALDDIVMQKIEDSREDYYNSTELASVMDMLDALKDEWQPLPEGLDTDIKLFQEALNTAHNNGSMAEYILEVDGMPDRDAGNFLSDLSENPEHGEKWDSDISRLLGYPVRTRIIPKSDWFVSSHLKIAIQMLAKLARSFQMQRRYP